jgi:hypothetical protein
MTVGDARPALDRLTRFPRLRGIRQQLHWHENALYRFASRPDLCADPAVRRNVARLADYGLVFELQVFAEMLREAGCASLCLLPSAACLAVDPTGLGGAILRSPAGQAILDRHGFTAPGLVAR